MKIKLKDKIFLGLVAVGLIAFLYNKITINFEKNPTSEESNSQTKNENRPAINIEESSQKIFNFEEKEIFLSRGKIKVWLADSAEKRHQGLSDVESLKQDEGMLFIHPEPGFYDYVMRRMNFDLDFVFILENEIIDVRENISKDFSGIVASDFAYDKVLELNAGTVEKLNILKGEKINF